MKHILTKDRKCINNNLTEKHSMQVSSVNTNIECLTIIFLDYSEEVMIPQLTCVPSAKSPDPTCS